MYQSLGELNAKKVVCHRIDPGIKRCVIHCKYVGDLRVITEALGGEGGEGLHKSLV